ncbi:MAG: hypothetical protein K8T20_16390 [Planctomycetes bacterium]|nr:hypothetical protein [Planctomycetota bacterium]
MLALYQPHNVLWFLPVTLVGLVLFAISTVRSKSQGRRSPGPFQFFTWGMGAAGIVGMMALKGWDNSHLRNELRAVIPAEVSHVTLARGATTHPIDDPAAGARVIALLRDLKNISAHHSHPLDPVTVAFEFRGEPYLYRVGRDSDVPGEFWVIRLPSGSTLFDETEIGRLQTSEWAPLVDELLKEKR